jgi:DNA-binding response OmpR family regulator
VIVVDQDTETTQLMAELLRDEGFAPLCYPAWLLSVRCIEQAQADLIILELGLGDPATELDLLGELRRNLNTRALPVIVDSTDERLLERLAEPLRDLGCIVLAKPFELDDFLSSVRISLDTSRSPMRPFAT